jgi:hypothetical protein
MAVTKLTDMIEFTFLIFVSFSFSQAAANIASDINNPYIKNTTISHLALKEFYCHWKYIVTSIGLCRKVQRLSGDLLLAGTYWR